jgi:HlyD family secretion protein
MANLHEQRAVAEVEVVRSRTARDAQEARIASLERRRNVLGGQLASARAEREAAQENQTLRTAERRELEAALAGISLAEAELEEARVRLAEAELRSERHTVRAPIDGIVLERLKAPGSKVSRMMDNPLSAVVVTLYDPEKLQVRVDVPLADAAKIAVGQQAEIIAEILPNQTFQGEVSRIVHKASVQKNTLEVQVALLETSPFLRPEVLSRVRFLAVEQAQQDDEKREALYIPESAVKDSTVWIVSAFDGDRGTARRRSVTLGETGQDGWVEVRSGIRGGDIVVLQPSDSLRDNRPVRVTDQ